MILRYSRYSRSLKESIHRKSAASARVWLGCFLKNLSQGNDTANGHNDGTPGRRKTTTTRPARTWNTLHDGNGTGRAEGV